MKTNIQTLGVLPSNTAAQNGAAMAAIFTNSPDLSLYAPGGHYLFDRSFYQSGNLFLEGDGDDTVFDFSGATGNQGLTISGSLQAMPGLSSAYRGDSFIPFASYVSMLPGEIFVMYDRNDYSWSASRPLYHKAEFARARGMGPSNVVRLTNPLYDSYTPANTDVYKLVSPRVSLKNFKIVGTTMTGLIRISLCDSPEIDNVNGYHEAYQVIEFDRCYKPQADGCDLYNKGDGRDDYGLVLTNCQHARVWGGYYYARRHGIAIGGDSNVGAVIGRDIRVNGATISNDITTDVFSADMHGNIEDSSYNHCTIYNGAGLAGRNNGYNNCTIYNGAGGWCVYGGEVQGGEIYVKNSRLITNGDPSVTSRGIVDIGGNSISIGAHTVHTLSINIENNSVRADNASASTSFMVMANGGSQVNINPRINGLVACGDMAYMGAILRTRLDAGGVYSKGIVVDNISGFPTSTAMHIAQGGAYQNVPQRLQS